MGRTLSVTICALLLMSYASIVQPTPLPEDEASGLSDMQIETLEMSYPSMFSSERSNQGSGIISKGWLASNWGGTIGTDGAFGVAVDHNGDALITGTLRPGNSHGQYFGGANTSQIDSNPVPTVFVAKMNSNGIWLWISTAHGPASGNIAQVNSIAVDSNGDAYITGSSYGSVQFGTFQTNTCQVECMYVAKISSSGDWLWLSPGATSGQQYSIGKEIMVAPNGNVVVSGECRSYLHIVNASNGGNPIPQSNRWCGTTGIFIAMYDSNGTVLSVVTNDQESISTDSPIDVEPSGLATDSQGNVYISGSFRVGENHYFEFLPTSNCSLTTIAVSTGNNPGNVLFGFIAKFDSSLNCIWMERVTPSDQDVSAPLFGIAVSPAGDVYVASTTSSNKVGQIQFGDNLSMPVSGTSSSPVKSAFVAKLAANGTWEWYRELLGTETHPCGVAYDSTSDAVVVTGTFAPTLSIEGSQSAVTSSGNWEVFVLGISSSGIDSWLTTIGGNGYDYGYDLAINSDGIVFVVGETEGAFRASGLQVSGSQGHFDIMVGILAPDYDGDGTPDLTDLDDDGDMLPDVVDNCAFSPFGFASSPILDHDGDGCRDSDEDDDDDGDSIVDILDSCPIGVTGWISSNLTDIDSDGCSDAMEDLDDDADGVNDSVDLCPTVHGNSTYEFEEGCPDSDGDGRPDIRDEFGDDPTEWSDIDNDEVGDNADAFPMDFTQQNDTDGDGHGDNPYGTQGDWFPDDPTRWADADRDGVADEDDAFVNDATQWNDTDGDGHGDELAGNQGDAFPEDPSEWQDSDSDGVGNNADDFPFDPSQQTDSDGDGFGDNPLGSGADKFPDDPSQWSDIDGDGFGDNQTGTDADVFIADPTQHSDRDGDGYGDSLSGRLADLFPDNPTQWIDQDGDGLGDNLSGTDADPYLFDFDNDGYNDSIDILPKLSSPGDHDNDGCPDLEDLFPLDYKECSNFDGDEEGDNADTDDDNDGWTDTDEVRLGTDPNDPDDYPIDSFELQIPGTAIGLGAWDLIGIFGGVPLFAWIGFGFVTRNTRCRKFESMLRDANTPKELEKVALKWEYSLMLRLLGPHQGIRLERLRSELDDAMAGETHHIPEHIEPEDITEDQTHIVEDEMVTGVAATGPSKDITGRVAEDGYEWTMFEGVNYYRMPNSGDDWKEWQG